MKILFTRHGESQANILHEMSNRGLKHPLTPRGRFQAVQLARRLERYDVTHIYSSPVLRAIETSVILANHLGIEYQVTEALREYDVGELEGRSDAQAWRDWQTLFDDWSLHRYERRLPGGESFHEVRERFVPFIEGLCQQHADRSANLLCVAHGGLYWMMLPLVLTNVDQAALAAYNGVGYTALVVAERRPEGLVCLEWDVMETGLTR
jgi:broad specificity phosphatase PhoE